MRRNSANLGYVLGAKHQLSILRPQVQELANNWGDKQIIDLKCDSRDNCEGLLNGDFALTLHCVKDGEIELIANVKSLGYNIKLKGLAVKERNISLVKYRSLEECLSYLADFDQTAEFWGDCLYDGLGEPNWSLP